MKKYVSLFLILALLLCGCAADPQSGSETQAPTQTEPSKVPATESSETQAPTQVNTEPPETQVMTQPSTEPPETQPPTEPATEPTGTEAATQPTDPYYELTVEDWQLEEPECLSYEEYFSQPRDLENSSIKWVKDGRLFTCTKWNGPVRITSDDGGEYTVPDSEGYDDYYLAGANGRYAYLFNQDWFFQLDLETGIPDILLALSGATQKYLMDNLVLYYSAYENQTFTIGRMYLPTMEQEILYQQEGEFYQLYFEEVNNTAEPLAWTLINPEFVEVVKGELSDPDSPYKSNENYDYSRFWDQEDGLNDVMHAYNLMHKIQDGTGVRALLRCTYDPAGGSYSEQTGIVDHCYYGSEMGHDHYNPDVTTAPEPEILMGEWVGIEMPSFTSQAGEMILLNDVDSSLYLYAKTDGDYQKILAEPVKFAVAANTCVVCVTADDRVLAVSYDGAQSAELYRAGYGHIERLQIGCEMNRVVIRDGDTLVEIELDNGRYRELARHDNLYYFYIDSDYEAEKDVGVYFIVRVGLHCKGYALDLATGEVDEEYRL